MAWKRFPNYHPSVRVIHRSQVFSNKGPVMGSFGVLLLLAWENVDKTDGLPVIWDAMTPIWRHYNETSPGSMLFFITRNSKVIIFPPGVLVCVCLGMFCCMAILKCAADVILLQRWAVACINCANMWTLFVYMHPRLVEEMLPLRYIHLYVHHICHIFIIFECPIVADTYLKQFIHKV